MSKHLIRDINIDSYKLFRDFEVKNLGRVNLIGGKNGIGKSAFMEACYINSGSFSIKEFIYTMFNVGIMRVNSNILSNDIVVDKKSFIEKFRGVDIKSSINRTHFEIEESNGIKRYIFDFADEHIEVNANDFSFDTAERSSNQFIDNFGLSYSHIVSAYGYMQRRDEEQYLNEILNQIDSRIKAFKIIEDKPQCKVGDRYLELSEFGDGIKQVVSIITTLYKSENGYIYIDEIDNGIHYIMLDSIWEAVLTLSKRLNVQVFAVTHSKECIESFGRVQKSLNDEESCYCEMYRNLKKDRVEMRLLDTEQLEFELETQGRFRGE